MAFNITTIMLEADPGRNDDCRDDQKPETINTFKVMFFLTLASMAVCLVNGYLMWKSSRIQNSTPLALFFGFSWLTLIVLTVYFGDSYGLYPCSIFNIFMKLPTFTYVSMAYAYMMNWYE